MLKNSLLFKSRPFLELPGKKPSADYHRGEAYYHTLRNAVSKTWTKI